MYYHIDKSGTVTSALTWPDEDTLRCGCGDDECPLRAYNEEPA